MSVRSLLTASSLLAAVALLPAQHALADSIFNYNVVTSGNLTSTNSADIYGNSFIGGKLTVNNAGLFGKDTSGNEVSVMGTTTGAGNIKLGGPSATLTHASGIDNSGHLSTGTSILGSASSLSSTMSGFKTEMSTDSTYYASLVANNTFTYNAKVNTGTFNISTTTFNSTYGNTAVFNITSAQLFNQNENLALLTSGSINTIIINVSGVSDITAGGENFTTAEANWSSYDSNIIWNFTNATTITLGTAWQGTILAPKAAVTVASGASDVYGAVYAASLNLTSGNEIHNDLYNIPVLTGSKPPASTPLPLSVWSGALLLTALSIRRLKSAQ
jgi:choice-of-anchor A domain-containing protein